MPIGQIADGDTGLDTRTKLNEVIDKANFVDAKAEQSALETETNSRVAADVVLTDRVADLPLPANIGQNIRPGDAPLLFTATLDGKGTVITGLSDALVVIDSDGKVIRTTGAQIVGMRAERKMTAGRLYRVRMAVRRRTDPADPSNDTVRLGLQWLSSTGLATTQTVISDLNALVVADGRQELTVIVATAAGGSVDHVAPGGTVYARPFVEIYGSPHETDVEIIEWQDVSDLSLMSPDVSTVQAAVAALESLTIDSRLTTLEGLYSGPEVLIFKSRTAAAAATISVSVDTIKTTGSLVSGDGKSTLFKRVGSEPADGNYFQSIDGAWWDSVEGFETVALLIADTATYTTYTEGDRIEAGGYFFEVAASGASDHHAITVGLVKLYEKTAPLTVVKGGTETFFQMGIKNSLVDSTIYGGWCFDGGEGFENKVGVNNTAPTDGGFANDTGYVAGDALYAAILAGYDNVNNALAGLIAGYHCMISSGATHATIFGGSLHLVGTGADYVSIFGGTLNTIEADCNYAVILGGENNLVEYDATLNDSGFRSVIIGSNASTASGRNAMILGGVSCTITGHYGTIINGEFCTAGGNHAVAVGNSSVADGAYSFASGNAVSVSGSRSFGFGDNITSIDDYTWAFGYRPKPATTGQFVFASRQRGNTQGNNQALMHNCSQETTDATLTSLSIIGSTTYPIMPADSAVSGTWYLDGVDDSGNIASFQIAVTIKRVGTGIPVISHADVTSKLDEITVAASPIVNGAGGGIYRLRVYGKAATNVRWNATFYGQQIVWT